MNSPHPILTAVVELMLLNFLIYTLSDRRQELHTIFGGVVGLNLVHLPQTLLFFKFPLGTSETSLSVTLVHSLKTVLPPRMPLKEI